MKNIKEFNSPEIRNYGQKDRDINENWMAELPLISNVVIGGIFLSLIISIANSLEKKFGYGKSEFKDMSPENKIKALKKINDVACNEITKKTSLPGVRGTYLAKHARLLKSEIDYEIEKGNIKSYDDMEKYIEIYIESEGL